MLLAPLFATVALLQAQSPFHFRAPASVAIATRATAPRVDGRLDDEVWNRATPTGSFRQRDPEEGAPGTERTEVRVLYDDEALFVGVRAFDSRPDQISAPLARRDERPLPTGSAS